MEKRHAIAYWLLPGPGAHELLARKIHELARRFDAPLFVPHVTIFIAPERSGNSAQILAELGATEIDLTIQSIRFSEQFTKTLFVQFERSDRLQQLGDKIRKASSAPKRQIIDPHLSLLYANIPSGAKQKLSDEIMLPFRQIHFSSVCAVCCARPTTTAREVEQWKVIAPRSMFSQTRNASV